MAINEKYSYKDFTNVSLLDHDPAGFGGEIRGSCFYQEAAKDGEVVKRVFPEGTGPLNLDRCNMDNVDVPLGSTVTNCSLRHMQIQLDGEDWILIGNKPTVPVDKARFLAEGKSIDPEDIPVFQVEA